MVAKRKKQTDPDSWCLLINGEEVAVRDVQDLRSRIAKARRKRFAEVQLVRGERPEHNLFALFNRDRAVMSYSHNIDEACYSARQGGRRQAGETLDFYLSNGQCDEYTVSETVPAEVAAQAFEYFLLKSELLPRIKWQKEV